MRAGAVGDHRVEEKGEQEEQANDGGGEAVRPPTFKAQQFAESAEQSTCAVASVLFQQLFEVPNRSRVRHVVPGLKLEKLKKAEAVYDLKLSLLVAEPVILLKD